MKKKKGVLLNLDEELYEQLKKEAEEKGLNITNYLRLIISQRV